MTVYLFVSAAAPSCGGAAELQQADVRPAGRSDRITERE